MKKHFRIFSAWVALSATAAVLAQDTTPAGGPAAPTPAATEAAPDSTAKAQKRKPTGVKTRVEINPAATGLVKGDTVNVRGQPSFLGEVVGHVQKDATVTVLEEITLSHPPSGEPPKWYKIAMPTNIPVWVKSDYIDAATKAVKVHRVNLRGGPGENYSVVGRLDKGAMINEVRNDKGWVAIDAPTNAYGFVAAELLDIQAAPAPAPAPPVAAAAPPPETVTVNTPAAPIAATPAPATPEPVAAAPVTAAPVAPAPTAPTETAQELAALQKATAAAIATPPPPRIVTREGLVHKAYNIQSPTDFELHDIHNGELIEYLQPQGQQNFKIYVGTRVSITGPEVIDQRWPRTPVLQVQTVELIP